MVVSVANSDRYSWGDGCLGWKLLQGQDLSVIQEEVPPGKAERRHYHTVGRQFFYILDGTATMEVNGHAEQLSSGQGIEIEPGAPHKFMNNSQEPVRFLVITAPKPDGDRVDVE